MTKLRLHRTGTVAYTRTGAVYTQCVSPSQIIIQNDMLGIVAVITRNHITVCINPENPREAIRSEYCRQYPISEERFNKIRNTICAAITILG